MYVNKTRYFEVGNPHIHSVDASATVKSKPDSPNTNYKYRLSNLNSTVTDVSTS
jgi:hypothetical protein